MDVETQAALWIIEENIGLTEEQMAERDKWLASVPGARNAYNALRATENIIDRAWPRKRKPS